MITETRERFLKAIVAQVPAEHIAEIHFFSPIKQGGVESGVAVIAESVDPEPIDPDAQGEVPQPPSPSPRHVIYTARYRLTLKGPDRGKWETNVTAEADAPLVTLEAVVRGVQRRSGDVDEASRMEGDEVRAIVDAKMLPGQANP
jgi:hypothetical protein